MDYDVGIAPFHLNIGRNVYPYANPLKSFGRQRLCSVSGHLTLVCYEKFERIETSQFHFVLLNMIIIIEKA